MVGVPSPKRLGTLQRWTRKCVGTKAVDDRETVFWTQQGSDTYELTEIEKTCTRSL